MLKISNAWKFRIITSLIEAGLIKLDVWMCRLKVDRDFLNTEDLYALLNLLFPTKEFLMDHGVRVEDDLFSDILRCMEPEREAL